MGFRRLTVAAIVLIAGLAVSLPGHLVAFLPPEPATARQSTAGPTPTPDRLAPPPMPENPTIADTGREVYYYHCCPCHGDRGQGLTDEWRAVWVEDHQNCWARGCHGGRLEDQGFPIPRTIPAVVAQPAALAGLGSLKSLTQYLAATHPPQTPGSLEPSQYQALAVFLLTENGMAVAQHGQVLQQPGLPAVSPGLMILTMAVIFAAAYAALRLLEERGWR